MDEFARTWSPRMLSVMRIAVALMLLQHGTAKLLGFPKLDWIGPDFSLTSPGGIAGFFELIGGALLVLGLFTRPVAFLLSGMMAVAYFMVHAPQGFYPIVNQGELAVVYCFVFLYLAVAGGGSWSLDAAFRGTGATALSRA
jgi:putative oxidoreductase